MPVSAAYKKLYLPWCHHVSFSNLAKAKHHKQETTQEKKLRCSRSNTPSSHMRGGPHAWGPPLMWEEGALFSEHVRITPIMLYPKLVDRVLAAFAKKKWAKWQNREENLFLLQIFIVVPCHGNQEWNELQREV